MGPASDQLLFPRTACKVPAVARFLVRAESGERGQTLVEYGLVPVLVSIMAIVSITFFGGLIYNACLATANYIGSR